MSVDEKVIRWSGVRSPLFPRMYGCVAQSVVRLTLNQKVVSSSLITPTNLMWSSGLRILGFHPRGPGFDSRHEKIWTWCTSACAGDCKSLINRFDSCRVLSNWAPPCLFLSFFLFSLSQLVRGERWKKKGMADSRVSNASELSCWFDIDPQSLPVQVVGYSASAIVIGHGIPSLIKMVRSKNPSHVPLGSLVARMVLGVNIAVFGLLICQMSQVVSGVGSFLVLLSIAILKGVYTCRKKLDTGALGTEALGTGALGTEALGTGALGTGALGTGALGTEEQRL